MKAETLQILWHDKEPIYTCDTSGDLMVTAGVDSVIRMWRVIATQGKNRSVEFLQDLTGHSKTINVVRFAPNGKFMASAGDDYNILVFRQNDDESWSTHRLLRGHVLDVCDLAWSPDSSQLVSGSVDNVMFLWDLTTGSKQEVKRHEHYVQGVAWSPCGTVIASQSSDRTCCVMKQTGPSAACSSWSEVATLSKGPDGKQMFCDEDCPTFFRRLCFSPEGSLLMCPTGNSSDVCEVFKKDTQEAANYCAFIATKDDPQNPVLQLPGFKKPVVAMSCCPLLFEKMDDGANVFDFPYRIVYAVASLDTVTLFDTQHEFPIATVSGLHYHTITDIAWSSPCADNDSNGLALVVSSADGFCSFVNFACGELGSVLPKNKLPTVMRQREAVGVTTTKGASQPVVNAFGSARPETVNTVVAKPAVRRKGEKRIAPEIVKATGSQAQGVAATPNSALPQDTPDCMRKAPTANDEATLEKKDKKRRIAPLLVSTEPMATSPAAPGNTTSKGIPEAGDRRRISPQLVKGDTAKKGKRISPTLVVSPQPTTSWGL